MSSANRYILTSNGNICLVPSNSELYHHGVKGMKWGVRRYQNADGSLTAAGKKRRAKAVYNEIKKNSNNSYWDRNKAAISKLDGDPSYEKLKSEYRVAQDKFIKATKDYDSTLKQWNKEQPLGFRKELDAAMNKILASAKKKFGDNLDDNDEAEWYMEDEIIKARDDIGGKYSGYKKVTEARSRFEKAGNDVDTAVKNVANEILDHYADTKITVAVAKNSKHKYQDTVGAILAEAMSSRLRESYYATESIRTLRRIGDD